MKLDPEEHYTIKELLYPDFHQPLHQPPLKAPQSPTHPSTEIDTQTPTDAEALLSKTIWTSNPGYLPPTAATMTSVTHSTFSWDADEV